MHTNKLKPLQKSQHSYDRKAKNKPVERYQSVYAMNTFMSITLQGLSPFELVFTRKPRQLTGFHIPPINSFPVEYKK